MMLGSFRHCGNPSILFITCFSRMLELAERSSAILIFFPFQLIKNRYPISKSSNRMCQLKFNVTAHTFLLIMNYSNIHPDSWFKLLWIYKYHMIYTNRTLKRNSLLSSNFVDFFPDENSIPF